ncbi:hypothetical protein HMN09_00362200 [Mycena chlorophos]|uniref:Uncharacterized protein n=1 Tax=Mycena chlorophos TaxID=658473 RepID=A0A8H6TGY9_MYCCL|nr:hypothetical protein HMN09_00362200 [Mycena chlorophos]
MQMIHREGLPAPLKLVLPMALHNISVPFANLLGLTLSSLLYGIYLVLFLVYIYLGINGTIARNAAGGTHSTISRRVVKAMKTPIFLASLALFFTATGTWILTIYRNFRGWIPSDGGPANPSVFFDANADISETIQNALDALSLLIGDAMIVSFVHFAMVLSGELRENSQIYRLWAVWPDWRILAPVLISFTGLIISLIITIVNTTRISVISQDVGITAISVFELLTTLYCTLFISFKIYNVASASASSAVGERTLTYFLAIFAESAAAYTAWILLYALLTPGTASSSSSPAGVVSHQIRRAGGYWARMALAVGYLDDDLLRRSFRGNNCVFYHLPPFVISIPQTHPEPHSPR